MPSLADSALRLRGNVTRGAIGTKDNRAHKKENKHMAVTADAYYDVPADDDTWCLECECNPCECDEDPAEPDWESEAELRAEMRSEDW